MRRCVDRLPMSEAVDGPLCIALDTNQWKAHTMLRSHLSASLIYLIEQHSAKLGVPEVVSIEVRDHLIATFAKSLSQVKDAPMPIEDSHPTRSLNAD